MSVQGAQTLPFSSEGGGWYEYSPDPTVPNVQLDLPYLTNTQNTTATLTTAQLLLQMLYTTPAAAITLTLPSGQSLYQAFANAQINLTFDLWVVNLATASSSDTATIAADAGATITLYGSAIVGANSSGATLSSGQFRFFFTGDGVTTFTWACVRIA